MNRVSVPLPPNRVSFIHLLFLLLLLFLYLSFSRVLFSSSSSSFLFLLYFHPLSHLAEDSLRAKRFYLQKDEEFRVDRQDEEKKRAALAPGAAATAALGERASPPGARRNIFQSSSIAPSSPAPRFSATTHIFLSLSFCFFSFFSLLCNSFLNLFSL